MEAKIQSLSPQQDSSSVLEQDAETPALVEKFVIRLPQGLRDQIKEVSEHNRRSMNSEIIMVLEQYIQQQVKIEHQDLSSQEATEQEVYLDNQTRELNRRLEALPADKKNALLSLLG